MTTDHLNKPNAFAKTEDTSPGAFFRAVFQSFQRAEEVARGSIDHFYTIGGFTIRLRFAGSALVPFFTRALQHMATRPTSSPALTICFWESASTGTEMPSLPWKISDYMPHGGVRGYNDHRFYTAVNPGIGMLNMLDAMLDLAIYGIRDARQLPYNETCGSPLLWILNWWMSNHGRQLVHAGAVGTSKGGVLLVGKGGSGKSTTALACLDSELMYLSDDYCLLNTEQPVTYAYSLYSSGKLNGDNIHRLPHLAQVISNSGCLNTTEKKALFFLHEHCPEKIATSFPIRAILLPCVTENPETSLTPVSPMTALRALAPSTIFQLHRAGYKAFHEIATLVKQVPCYILELGPDVSKVPNVILHLLSGLSETSISLPT